MRLSDCHTTISTFFKACLSGLRAKVIYYRSYKKLNKSDLLYSLEKANLDLRQMTQIKTTTF